ncbi:hypothetical protein BKA62DRAFT_709198 [Auriculariales sp. MPI-PUGE-AT-0066]|nr:hypothetical protein BKA62DRAFT_709198 [Auriculariales sp. MPI-PUGE-AT-0066]
MADVEMSDARGPNKRQRKPYERPERDAVPDGQWLHDRAPRANLERANKAGGTSSDKWVHDKAPTSGRESNEATQKLIVSNLHYEVSEKDLSSAFSGYGSFTRDPIIRYDRSGRSTGVGVVIYTTADQATLAKHRMQGVILKGEAIDIKFEKYRPDKPGKSDDPNSLLNRIGKPALKDRISTPDERGDVKMSDSSRTGPIRTARGSHGGRASSATRGRGRGARGGGRGEKKAAGPKSAADLDSELDKYANAGGSGPSAASAAATGPDIDMS